MDIQTRKIEFIQEFLKIQSEEVIAQFEKLLKKGKSEKVVPFSVEELNQRIDESEQDFVRGNFKTASELRAKYK